MDDAPNRRAVLQAVGTGIVGGLAGCSGDGNGDSVNDDDDGNDESGPTTATQTRTSDTAATTSPKPTQTTEAEFSTRGDDETSIEASPEDLVITADAIPKDGYTLDNSSSEDVQRCSYFVQNWKSQNSGATIHIQAGVCESVAAAQKRYDLSTYEYILGGAHDSEQLAIAVESVYSVGTHSGESGSLIRFRDANATGVVAWTTQNDPIAKQAIGELAVTMHQNWR